MKLRYTVEALRHIDSIYSYIERRNPEAAARVVVRIRAAAEQLSEFPQIGHTGIVADTREWVVKGLPYVLVHETDTQAGELVILAVFHGAQDRERE